MTPAITTILVICLFIYFIKEAIKDNHLKKRIKELLDEEAGNMLYYINRKGGDFDSEAHGIASNICRKLTAENYAHFTGNVSENIDRDNRRELKRDVGYRYIALSEGISRKNKKLEEYQTLKTSDTEQANEAKFANLVYIGEYHFVLLRRLTITKIVNHAEWSARMIEEIGDSVKPHLEKIWAELAKKFESYIR